MLLPKQEIAKADFLWDVKAVHFETLEQSVPKMKFPPNQQQHYCGSYFGMVEKSIIGTGGLILEEQERRSENDRV